MAAVAAARPDFFASEVNGVVFADCFVRVQSGRVAVEQHSPDHRARQRYPFPFESSDKPVQWLQFLDDVFRDDDDKAEKIAALQEFAGAAILGMAPLHERALVLFGKGDNGKSRLVKILTETMPPGSVTALEPGLWADQYQRSGLAGSRLNTVADLGERAALTAIAKGIISGEPVAARDPGNRRFDFTPRAAHLFGCNKLPSTADTSPGFWRRWLFVPLNRSFTGDPTRDPRIAEKIIAAEIPAIVRWALEGAARLDAAGGYTVPASHQRILDRWRAEGDSVRVFLDQCTEPCPLAEREFWTRADALYEAFEAWAPTYGVHLTSTAFGKELSALGVQGKKRATGKFYAVRLVAVTG